LALAWDGLLFPADAASGNRVCDMTGCTVAAEVLVAEPSGSLLVLCPGDAIRYVGEPALRNAQTERHQATLPSPASTSAPVGLPGLVRGRRPHTKRKP
jgi:hypothetical protein